MAPNSNPVVDALVLAAGASSRLAPHHKLLATGAAGRSLIAITLAQVQASAVRATWVVLGHQHAAIAQAIGPTNAHLIHCPDYAAGLSRSLHAGLRALPPDADAVLICLGDMPLVTPTIINALIAAFRPGDIVVPLFQSQRGNPTLWDRSLIPEMLQTTGDQGARALLHRHPTRIRTVAVPHDAVLRDADTAAALRELPGGPWHAPDGTLI